MLTVQMGSYMGLDNACATFFANNNAASGDVYEYGAELIYCSLWVQVDLPIFSWAMFTILKYFPLPLNLLTSSFGFTPLYCCLTLSRYPHVL
jgi:hypothetical protein